MKPIAILSAATFLLVPGVCGQQQTPLVASHARTAASPAAAASATVVARVNGATLTERDLQREMQKLFPYASVHGNRIPGDFSKDIRQKALQTIVQEEMLHQEALRTGVTVPASVLADLLQQAQERFPSPAAFESYATQEYGGVKAFQQQLRRGVMIALLLEREVTKKARVPEVELQKFYAANKKRFLKPPSIALQSVTIQVPPNATAAQQALARKRAEEVLKLVRAARTYEEFGQVAEKYSEDDWRVMMGDHRWVHRGRLPEAIENVAFSMKKGETSGIITSQDALVVIRVNEVQPQTQIPFAQVRESLRSDLQKAKEGDLRAQLDQRLRKAFKVEEL